MPYICMHEGMLRDFASTEELCALMYAREQNELCAHENDSAMGFKQ
jgi:hypothetical protein